MPVVGRAVALSPWTFLPVSVVLVGLLARQQSHDHVANQSCLSEMSPLRGRDECLWCWSSWVPRPQRVATFFVGTALVSLLPEA